MSEDIKALDSEDYEKLAQELANSIVPLLACVDAMLLSYKIESIDTIISNMEDTNSYLAAWPFPETMSKAKVRTVQTKVFVKIRDLIVARKEQLAVSSKEDNAVTSGQQVLDMLGF